MQFTAKLIQILPLQSGTGRNGEWKKQDIIVETEGQYPKKICVAIWGDKIDESVLKINNMLDISFDVESREYNGRWYTDVKAWKVEPVVSDNMVHQANEQDIPERAPIDFTKEDGDDLPF